mmetsp:Transcript_20686/g.63941  ORF Transcript_20686/g.63941 Transcript_20686/m.63941 type:complete len:169 (+) Transcript_20686:115-621(+)
MRGLARSRRKESDMATISPHDKQDTTVVRRTAPLGMGCCDAAASRIMRSSGDEGVFGERKWCFSVYCEAAVDVEGLARDGVEEKVILAAADEDDDGRVFGLEANLSFVRGTDGGKRLPKVDVHASPRRSAAIARRALTLPTVFAQPRSSATRRTSGVTRPAAPSLRTY